MQFIDTHTHLYADEFDLDRDEVIRQSLHFGIDRFYLPNVDSGSIERMLALEASYPEKCFAMMGLHPCSVKENVDDELNIVKQWLNKRSFKAVGEIGIDLYWDKTFLKQQQLAFAKQIEWAIEYKLPIVIHCRDSFNETFEIVQQFKGKDLKGIFHCFSGTLEQAQQIISLGSFMLGIGGVLTFKNAGIDKVVHAIDLKHLVLETDSPYLAPVPHRGKRNSSAYIRIIAEKLAEIKQVNIHEVAEITTRNAFEVFGK